MLENISNRYKVNDSLQGELYVKIHLYTNQN